MFESSRPHLLPVRSLPLAAVSPVIDVLLLLMAVFWGTNYSIVKHAFREIDPQAFNAPADVDRLVDLPDRHAWSSVRVHRAGAGTAAGSVFYTPATMTARDWLGARGARRSSATAAIRYCFMAGLSRTSVANSSLMLGVTPVLVALLSAMLGIERIGTLHWVGAALSLAGIYLVVGQVFRSGRTAQRGDLMMIAAVCCWAIYTIGARPLMTRHSPVAVTGLSMMIGTLMYLPLAWPSLRAVRWSEISRFSVGRADLLGGVRPVHLVHDLVRRGPADSAARGRPSTRTSCRSSRC